MDWIEQTQDQMAGACECGNETSYFVKCGEFIDQLLRKDSVPWTQLVGWLVDWLVSQLARAE